MFTLLGTGIASLFSVISGVEEAFPGEAFQLFREVEGGVMMDKYLVHFTLAPPKSKAWEIRLPDTTSILAMSQAMHPLAVHYIHQLVSLHI